jgi:hypothetical protein
MLVLGLLLTGCATRYDITQSNGTVIRAKTKPRLDKEKHIYTFKDMAGQEVRLSAGRVRLIEPVRRGSESKTFNAFEDFKKR